MGYILIWDIFLENIQTALPLITVPVAVNMDKTLRWIKRQVIPSLLMMSLLGHDLIR